MRQTSDPIASASKLASKWKTYGNRPDTGCNRGLGEEFALQYAAKGDRVIATCLDPEAFSRKHNLGANVEPARLDVTESAASMREVIDHSGPHQTGTFYNYNGQILPW